MNITLSAVEGTILAAAAVIPIILIMGSVEKILCLIDEIRRKRRLQKQVRLLRSSMDDTFHHAA